MYFSLPSMFRFSLDRHTDLDRIFNIHSGNGSLYTSKPLDRELSQWHNLTVIAAEISKMNYIYIYNMYIYMLIFYVYFCLMYFSRGVIKIIPIAHTNYMHIT
jgi:hypothetical protein